jgi:hypothetical protein
MNERRLRHLICLLAIPTVLQAGGCGCGSRSTLPVGGTGGGQVAPDSGAWDGGGERVGLGGSGGSVSDGAGAGSADSGGPAAGGTGLGGAGPGGAGGGIAMGGAGAPGGRGGGGDAGDASAGAGGRGGGGGVGGIGGAAAGGKGGGAGGTGGMGGAGAATGGKGGGAGGAGSGGTAIAGTDGGPGSGGADSATSVGKDASEVATDSGAVDDGGAPPLWRNSYRPFADEIEGASELSVWSDDRGVFILGARYPDAPNSYAPVISVWSNLGGGWQTTYTWPEGTSFDYGQGRVRLRGFVDGPLIALSVRPCAIQFVDSQGAHCSGSSRAAADVATVSADLAYATYANRLLRFDGALWTQLGDPLPQIGNSSALWADSSTVVVISEGNVFLVGSDGAAVPQSELPAGRVTAVWGFGSTNLWAGTADGQLFHCDGTTWLARASLADASDKITRLWGSDGDLFILTDNELAKWDGTRTVLLDSISAPGGYTDVWGNSSKEVFVVGYTCDDGSHCVAETRWFNGSVVGKL